MKRVCICFFIITFLLIGTYKIKPIRRVISKNFWEFIIEQMDKEEEQRQKDIENGEIIRGKDTIIIWGDTFELLHSYNDIHLSVKRNVSKNQYISDTILEKIKNYKINHGKLYIVSDDGFAILDENNNCRIYIYSDYDNFIQNDKLKYLYSFSNFSEEEQKMFYDMNIPYKK